MIKPKTIIHYSLHFIAPIIIAIIFFPQQWIMAYIIMLATILIDIDHLFAKPIFCPNRCSIGTHPLHSYPMIIVYFFLLFIPNLYIKIIAVGLSFHILTDWQNCKWD